MDSRIAWLLIGNRRESRRHLAFRDVGADEAIEKCHDNAKRYRVGIVVVDEMTVFSHGPVVALYLEDGELEPTAFTIK